MDGAAVAPLSTDGGVTAGFAGAGSTDVSAIVRSLVGIRRGSLASGVSGCTSRRVTAGPAEGIVDPVSTDGGSMLWAADAEEEDEEAPASRSSGHGAGEVVSCGGEFTARRGSVHVGSVRGCLATGSAAASMGRGRATLMCAPGSTDGGIVAALGGDTSSPGAGSSRDSLGSLLAGSPAGSRELVTEIAVG